MVRTKNREETDEKTNQNYVCFVEEVRILSVLI